MGVTKKRVCIVRYIAYPRFHYSFHYMNSDRLMALVTKLGVKFLLMFIKVEYCGQNRAIYNIVFFECV